MRNKSVILGLAIAGTCALAAVLAPVLAPCDPQSQHLEEAFSGPSSSHWLGQDRLGRDIASRIIYGSRASLLVGVCTVILSLMLGLTVGTIAGYSGGIADEIFMRTVDILQAFPGILLAVALAAVMGPRLVNIIIAISALGWVGFARMARGQALSIRTREYVLAAKAMGLSEERIVGRHVLPNLLGPLLIQAGFAMAAAILAESSLSFLGLGAQDAPSWGRMISEGTEFLSRAPHITVFPGLAVMFAVLGFTLLGEGLREALDPRRGAGGGAPERAGD